MLHPRVLANFLTLSAVLCRESEDELKSGDGKKKVYNIFEMHYDPIHDAGNKKRDMTIGDVNLTIVKDKNINRNYEGEDQ